LIRTNAAENLWLYFDASPADLRDRWPFKLKIRLSFSVPSAGRLPASPPLRLRRRVIIFNYTNE
jgi:hypothetical protein